MLGQLEFRVLTTGQLKILIQNLTGYRMKSSNYSVFSRVKSKLEKLYNKEAKLKKISERLTNGTHSQKPTDAVVEQILPS